MEKEKRAEAERQNGMKGNVGKDENEWIILNH